MKNFVILLFLCLYVFNPKTNKAQTISAKLDDFMFKSHQNNQFNGSVLIAKNSEIIFEKGYGYALKDSSRLNTPETIFRIGSITKMFTSTLILKLHEDGKLNLDDKITQYIPEYPKEKGDQIKIKHLLSHSSGITDYLTIPETMNFIKSGATPLEFIKVFCNEELLFTPGEKFQYSNSNYNLLGVIIESVTGKSYQEYVQEIIFDPLNMSNSGYINNNNNLDNQALGYVKSLNGLNDAISFHPSLPFSAGGLYSTAKDLYTFYLALVKNKIIDSKTTKLMSTPYFQESDNKYGFGVGIIEYTSENFKDTLHIIGHEGLIYGFRSLFHIINNEYCIVLLDNHENSTLLDISVAIRDVIFGDNPVIVKTDITTVLYNDILNKDIEFAIKKYYQLKADSIEYYKFDEPLLRKFGRKLFESGKQKEAIEILKLNVLENPNNINAYAILGQASYTVQNKQQALECFQKVLEFDPESKFAKKMIRKVEKLDY